MSIKKTELKKFYITTPIYYANAKPHIGHAYTTVAADVLARWNKLNGNDTFFLTGTDEHGLKIQKVAEKAGKEPQQFVDEISSEFKTLWKKLNIDYDNFIRTTDAPHKKAVQEALQVLRNKGAIYPGTYEGLYCVGCEQFKTENELIDGKCPDHNAIPEKLKEECYLLKMAEMQEELVRKIENDEFCITPDKYKIEILSFLKNQKLKDISISRKNVSWGIPLPFNASHSTYVWVDAFLNYLTGLGWEGDPKKLPKQWPPEVQLIGKDILRVHATIWPMILMHLGIDLPKKLFTHGHILAGGKKMSKTLGNVIAVDEMINKFGVDATRYLLMSAGTFGEDVDLTMERAAEKYASDLQNGIGNLVSRVLTMVENYFDGKIPEFNEKYKEEIRVPEEIVSSFKKAQEETVLLNNIENKNLYHYGIPIDEYKKEKGYLALRDFGHQARNGGMPSTYYDDLELNLVLKNVNNLIKVTDKYIQHYTPFKLIKENREKTGCILYECMSIIQDLAQLIQPFMPETSKKIFDQCGGLLLPGTKIKKGDNLFPRLK